MPPETELTTPFHFSPRQVTDAIRAGLREGRRPVDLSPTEAELLAAAYQGNLIHYHQHVRNSLDEGDYLQTTEKSWGAYTQTIKAIAADYGLRVTHHASLVGVAGQLATLAGQSMPAAGSVLRNGLAAARSLHQHFYESDLPDGIVTASADDVAAAITLLQALFSTTPAAGSTAD